MISLGLVLAVGAAVVGVAVVMENSEAAGLTAFGNEIPGVTAEWHVFVAGAVVAVAFVAGVTVAVLGLRRAVGIRRELRDLRDEHAETMQTLELEKRRLQQELAQARRNAPLHSG